MIISPIWAYNLERMRRIIESDLSDTAKLDAIQQTELFSVCSEDLGEQMLSARAWKTA